MQSLGANSVHKESVSMISFKLYYAGCCLKTKGRGRRACHWWDCWVLGAWRQACDLQASWDWSKYSWTPFHWTSLHDTGPGKNRIWGKRQTQEIWCTIFIWTSGTDEHLVAIYLTIIISHSTGQADTLADVSSLQIYQCWPYVSP